MLNHYDESPQILRDFLTYTETIRGKSEKTAKEYFLDLRTFFRYLKQKRNLVDDTVPFEDISILDIDIPFVKSITLSDIYDYLTFISRERPKYHNSPQTAYGNVASTRARKVSSIRSFFKYLTDKAHILEINPAQNLDAPKSRKSLPRYLSVDDSKHLLESVSGPFEARDYCILTLFLNCGLRVSELTNLDLRDVQDNRLRVLGKGNKERTLFLNPACTEAIEAYLAVRPSISNQHKNALFISMQAKRISPSTVKAIVKKYLNLAGLDDKIYSAHKLRHTAATLMYQNGVDIRTLQQVLGHKNLDTTMIYTHIADANLEKAALQNPLSHIERKKK